MIRKAEILKLLDEGNPLLLVFYTQKAVYQINGQRVSEHTARSLIESKVIKFTRADFSGITKHYYYKTTQSELTKLLK